MQEITCYDALIIRLAVKGARPSAVAAVGRAREAFLGAACGLLYQIQLLHIISIICFALARASLS